MDIAVVLTCFNRKEKTKKCIDTLLESEKKCLTDVKLHFYICDDGCTDGTPEMLQKYGDKVTIIKGTGNLFWARGMAYAMQVVEKSMSDLILMINDDVCFFEDSIQIMIDDYLKANDEMIAIVGSTYDKSTKEHSYGGYDWNGKAIHEKRIPVYPDSENRCCNQANWNCFLISRKLYNVVGRIDLKYEHSLADFDYSNRICKAGYHIIVASKYIGTCSRNQIKGSWRDKTLSPKRRFQLLHRPNGMPPKSNWYYCKKYYGLEGTIVFAKPYLSIGVNGVRYLLHRIKKVW